MVFHQLKTLSTPLVPSSLRLGCDSSYSTGIGFRLTFTQDLMVNKQDYVDLGQFCADVCKALDRGLEGRRSDELSSSVLEAIEKLTG